MCRRQRMRYEGKTAKERSCIWFQDGPAGGCCTVVRINLRLLVKIRALSFRLCAPARFVQPTCQGHSAGCVGQTFTWGAIQGDTGPPWIFFPRANDALYLASLFFLWGQEENPTTASPTSSKRATRVIFPNNEIEVSLRVYLTFDKRLTDFS